MNLIVILHNIRSCYNVGAILRTAEGLGVSEVILSGYTPRVHDPKLLPHLREKLDKEIHKTALGAENMVKISSVSDVKSEITKLKNDGYEILGLENNVENTILMNDLKIQEKVVLILGEEVSGIPEDLYGLIDKFVEIPMRGKKESLNVSVAAGIAIYDIMKL